VRFAAPPACFNSWFYWDWCGEKLTTKDTKSAKERRFRFKEYKGLPVSRFVGNTPRVSFPVPRGARSFDLQITRTFVSFVSFVVKEKAASSPVTHKIPEGPNS
jgi:hypothetical protein